jgi:hypothetical protein
MAAGITFQEEIMTAGGNLTLGQAREMLGVIMALWNCGASARFVLALARNRQRLGPEVAAWEETRTPAAEFLEFDRERVRLCEEMCVRDGNGNCRMLQGDGGQRQYFIDPAQQGRFDKGLARLRGQYHEVLEARERQLQEAEALLIAACPVVLDQVGLEHFPDGLTPAQMSALGPMLVED